MNKQKYYIIRTDNKSFYCGHDEKSGQVSFFPLPMLAKKRTKDQCRKIMDKISEFLFGAVLKMVPAEQRRITGQLLTFYLFDDELIIMRNLNHDAVEDWNEIYRSDESQQAKWNEIYRSDESQQAKWIDILESDIANGRVDFVLPEQIGALTEAPILGFDLLWDDDMNIELTADSRLYYYADYQVSDELEHLHLRRYVSFKRTYTESK